MRAVSSESGEKERGGEKGEENWLVGPVHGKEGKGKNAEACVALGVLG